MGVIDIIMSHETNENLSSKNGTCWKINNNNGWFLERTLHDDRNKNTNPLKGNKTK